MALSIQTNVNSLIAQENLRVNSNFQSQTIQRLTSGYRINQSGDDAAGLAVANKFRSDSAELMQGVRNANDGISTLQIIDGGMNNIGKMLDRLKTLATQSSSATFSGDRAVLNKEYQTLVNEVDRQAQSIGLSTGGHFGQSMGVYIGGGTTATGLADASNGTITLDLANSVVDSKALGLRTAQFSVGDAPGTNLASASNTSVANIVNANGAAGGATASFDLSGAGFSGMRISVGLGVNDTTQTLADKLNAAIQALGNSGTASGSNLRNANIQANAVTDSAGNEQLTFTSALSAFQATAASNTSNALMGHFDAASTNVATGASVVQTITGNAVTLATAAETVNLKVIVNGTAHTVTATLAGTEANAAAMLATVTGGAGYAALSASGVTAQLDGTGTKLQFVGNNNQSVQVQAGGDAANFLGMGAWSTESNTITGSAAAVNSAGDSATVGFSINGGQKILVNFTAGSTIAATRTAFQAALDASTELHAAGLTVTGATLNVASGNAAVTFRMNVESQTGTLDLKFGVGASSTATLSAVDKAAMVEANGSSQTGLGTSNDVFSFAGLKNIGAAGGTLNAGADQQVLSFSANDTNGKLQSQSVTLAANNASTLDQAIQTINNTLQASGNATMKQIVAVKETNASGTAEGIRFISSLNNFSVASGQAANSTAANPVGLYDGTSGAATQGMTTNSSASGSMDIKTAAGAMQAVVALGLAVQKLGVAQAAIGKGQNQLSYAISLANSQISNFASAQAQIRDADVAAEAANLSKAQVLQQASIAAMAQANSAPQAVLALLK